MRRDEKLKQAVEELTIGVIDTVNRLRADVLKKKAFQLGLEGEVIEEKTVRDKNGNETTTKRRKHPERLMLAQIASGDPSFRTIQPEAGGGGVASVTLNVTGFNPDVLKAKVSTTPGGKTQVELSAQGASVANQKPAPTVVDAELVEEKKPEGT
jgi:hypothetical protein